MISRLRTARAMSPAQRRLVARAYTRLCVVRLGLRITGFVRVRSWLGEGPVGVPVEPTTVSGRTTIAAILRAVDTASRLPPRRPTCLARSLALQSLLHQAGVPASLRIGVANPGPDFGAHAWVEIDGRPVGEAQPDALQRFAVLEPAAGGSAGATG